MSRISLVEAYDNRDVIGQIVRLRKDVDELLNILKDIDPNGDLTNVVTKTGDQTIDGIKTFIGKIVADCDIIQNGAAYETHAEQVFSKNDYIVTRDEAIAGLAPGTYSGLHVKKYNGVDDARLVVDNEGIARVGDVNDEQPLLTRDEVADMTSGNILTWDGVNKKAITSGKAVSDLVEGSGNIGSDDYPVKIVGGQAVAVANKIQRASRVYYSDTMTPATGVNDFDSHVMDPGLYQINVTVSYNGASNSHTNVLGIVVLGGEVWLQSGYNIPANDYSRFTVSTMVKVDSSTNFNVRVYVSDATGIVNFKAVSNILKIE